ncbi:MAG TPA: maltose alpha-D-glucosyltransferase [Stellaceae bacterium]|nr:maltose alpha-D-glucosyltransferase [Stellaceae bacterium]
MLPNDPTWYKDAIIYQLHVKAFFDGNDDGIGDFVGLTAKLDYLKDLGVTTLWLLPFYPSPLKDDGYDIADYRSINPAYGTMADFKHFVREAHRRGLRLITELVINHTSDQHPWFQRARAARPDSSHRDFYVWSDTDKKFQGTRIIFLDTEKSNWAWDPVAKAYYWHRFYSHQPDLNFDNPRVVRAVTDVMKFWLDQGVDGLRLDAVPYLVEREGTNNENLPESHAILKGLRAEIDSTYPNKMLLAEANQWPEDVLPYFGAGDECHMAFHFPLMPRLYMAVAQEDRLPITDIMRQTPDIPANCQWAIFLRNHDELTLEMVTDRERDYLWNFYASDPRMRINLGIRRRLAPLMENDRRRIDLLNGLLLSMPGTPVLYYGDELGMGDNVFLGDRDGVRTPMQWSPDRNGGFSRADPARLFLPPVMDPLYGFQAVNVEAQSQSSSSLLNHMRRLIAVRTAHQAFGRGTLRFLYPTNRKVLAYCRIHEEAVILCVANLSRSAQPVELDLSPWRGRTPIELLGRSQFPPIAERPYSLTLQGHGYFWFALTEPAHLFDGATVTEPLPDFVTLVMPAGWRSLVDGHGAASLCRDILPAFLPNQRWYGAKDRQILDIRILGSAELPALNAQDAPDGWALLVIDVQFVDGTSQRYLLPLGLIWGASGSEARITLLPQSMAQVRRFRAEGALYDPTAQDGFVRALLAAIIDRRSIQINGGELRFQPTSVFAQTPPPEQPIVRRLGAEQSNTSVLIEDYAVFKIYRRLQTGIHPEVEMARFLTEEAGFAATPPLLATIEAIDAEGVSTAYGVLTGFVRNQGDAWGWVQDYLRRTFDDATMVQPPTTPAAPGVAAEPVDPHGFFMTLAETLGQRTAELHRALCPAETADAAFAPEPISQEDLVDWTTKIAADVRETLAALAARLDAAPPLEPAVAALVLQVLAARDDILGRIAAAGRGSGGALKTRYHGDYHLGQVLVAHNDFVIIDFEGEPRRSLEERRFKHSPLRDVAGMVRSFDYAAAAAVRDGIVLRPAAREMLERFAAEWTQRSISGFLSGYRRTIEGCASYPDDARTAEDLLHLFMLEKAFYEIGYELANRPGWLNIPLAGVLGLIRAPMEKSTDDQAS